MTGLYAVCAQRLTEQREGHRVWKASMSLPTFWVHASSKSEAQSKASAILFHITYPTVGVSYSVDVSEAP